MADVVSVELRIEGRVQGVGYRAWLARLAATQGLDGWVRNTRDGAVEAQLKGSTTRVRAVVDACRGGPALARVDAIHERASDRPVDDGFLVLATR